MPLLRDLRLAVRSLSRVPALWITVALTLALGIGANAAIFSVVRAVLLRPLANRDEARLLYIRQSAPGLQAENTAFSVPEIDDLGKHLKTPSPSSAPFPKSTSPCVGLGSRAKIPAGVVDGHYFEVMGLRPVLGRLLGPSDDGPNAAGAVVLTYKFWTQSLHSDPTVLGKTLRLDSFSGSRTATIVGVLEPVGSLSRRHRNHRQRRHQPASPLRHHGHRPRTSHDRSLRPPRARRYARPGPRRAQHRLLRDDRRRILRSTSATTAT